MALPSSVAITGATGFIGWNLCEAFRDAGSRVRALVRLGNTKPIPAGVEAFEAALDSASLARGVERFDVFVHAAGLTRARTSSEFERVNVAGTRAAVDAANAAGVRLVHISSQAAIGEGTVARPAREDDPPRPLTAYGRSKLAAEEAVRAGAQVPWVILRPTSVYGPRDRQFLPLFRLASRGVLLQAMNPATPLTFIHVGDLARGVLLAAKNDRAANQALFLGHPTPLTAGELLEVLAGSFNRASRTVRLPGAVVAAAALGGELLWLAGRQPLVDLSRLAELRAEGFVCSVDRARDLLGFSASVPLAEGIAQTARWYRDRGWI